MSEEKKKKIDSRTSNDGEATMAGLPIHHIFNQRGSVEELDSEASMEQTQLLSFFKTGFLLMNIPEKQRRDLHFFISAPMPPLPCLVTAAETKRGAR
jgi:hypothetical protein